MELHRFFTCLRPFLPDILVLMVFSHGSNAFSLRTTCVFRNVFFAKFEFCVGFGTKQMDIFVLPLCFFDMSTLAMRHSELYAGAAIVTYKYTLVCPWKCFAKYWVWNVSLARVNDRTQLRSIEHVFKFYERCYTHPTHHSTITKRFFYLTLLLDSITWLYYYSAILLLDSTITKRFYYLTLLLLSDSINYLTLLLDSITWLYYYSAILLLDSTTTWLYYYWLYYY